MPLWKSAKYVRIQFLKNRKVSKCQGYNTLVNSPEIDDNIQAFETILNIEHGSEISNSNISLEILNLSGELFIYMNLCPKKQNDWILFYKDLISNNSLGQVILTLNRLRISEINHQDMIHVRDFASKIFDFCTKKFSLMYPLIQTFGAD